MTSSDGNVFRTIQWHHNERDDVLNHRRHDCLLNRLSRRRSNKTSKLRVTGLLEGNSPVTGEFLAQRTSHAGNVSIWWRHHDYCTLWAWIHRCNSPHESLVMRGFHMFFDITLITAVTVKSSRFETPWSARGVTVMRLFSYFPKAIHIYLYVCVCVCMWNSWWQNKLYTIMCTSVVYSRYDTCGSI